MLHLLYPTSTIFPYPSLLSPCLTYIISIPTLTLPMPTLTLHMSDLPYPIPTLSPSPPLLFPCPPLLSPCLTYIIPYLHYSHSHPNSSQTCPTLSLFYTLPISHQPYISIPTLTLPNACPILSPLYSPYIPPTLYSHLMLTLPILHLPYIPTPCLLSPYSTYFIFTPHAYSP